MSGNETVIEGHFHPFFFYNIYFLIIIIYNKYTINNIKYNYYQLLKIHKTQCNQTFCHWLNIHEKTNIDSYMTMVQKKKYNHVAPMECGSKSMVVKSLILFFLLSKNR